MKKEFKENKGDLEQAKVEKMIKDKDGQKLGKWLSKFSEKGTFWLREKDYKYKKISGFKLC